MSNFQHKYKQKRGGSNDPATAGMIRARRQEEHRRVNRAEIFSRNRDVFVNPQIQVPETQETPSPDVRLRRWKLEKELKREMNRKNKKPMFKVGVVHHNFYSPIAKNKIDNNAPCHSRGADRVKTRRSPLKRITRVTQKRLAAKMASSVAATSSQPGTSGTAMSTTYSQPSTSAAAASLTPSQPSTSAACASTQQKVIPCAEKLPCVSFAPQSYAFKGPVGVERMPMLRRFAIVSDFMSESAHLGEVEASEERPWPAKGNIPAVSELPPKNSTSLVQQSAVERLGLLGTSKHFSSSTDSHVEENRMKISEFDLQSDATASQPVESEDIPVVEKLQRSALPSSTVFSSFTTISRGTPLDDVPTDEPIIQSANISVEEQKHTARYFTLMLQRENERLNGICAKWEKVKGEPGLTKDARSLINQAIGQTTLLMRKKFERFRSLVADCEAGKGEMLVQCRDLHDSWDRTYAEIKNCNSRFRNLDQLHSKGWVKDEIVVTTKRPTGIRQKILARRKTMSQTEENDADVVSSNSCDDVFESDDVSRTNVTLRGTGKRLNIENEFISERENTDTAESSSIAAAIPQSFACPEIIITTVTPTTTKASRRSTSLTEPPTVEDHSQYEFTPQRVLRNRTVYYTNMPKKRPRRNTKSPSAQKPLVELDSSAKENDDPQTPARQHLSESSRIFDIECHSGEPNKIQRSTRNSLRFNAEDCTACADSAKPVHPMTPYSRRSRIVSLLGDNSRMSIGPSFDGDLISFDSPAVSSRIRRSSEASRKSSLEL